MKLEDKTKRRIGIIIMIVAVAAVLVTVAAIGYWLGSRF